MNEELRNGLELATETPMGAPEDPGQPESRASSVPTPEEVAEYKRRGAKLGEARIVSATDYPPIEKLRAMNVLWPEEVDRICEGKTHTKFLIEDLLPAKSIVIAAGESTIGKSALICQLAVCVSAGERFLDMRTNPGRVLYFDLENDIFDCQRMRDSLVSHLGLPETPRDFLLTQDPDVNLEEGLEFIHPKLVVFDSLRSYRPEVTDKNASAGLWLQKIRKYSHKYDCSFLIVHHLRKVGENFKPNLEDSTVSTWFQEMEGPHAFFNQTDVRIAIAEPDGRGSSQASLKMKWVARVHGPSPTLSLERVFNEDDYPMGYRLLAGQSLLDENKQAVIQALPVEFSTADAKAMRKKLDLGDGSDATNKFLAECKYHKVIERTGRGRWRKTG
jgi:hypothetical protein